MAPGRSRATVSLVWFGRVCGLVPGAGMAAVVPMFAAVSFDLEAKYVFFVCVGGSMVI